MYYLFWIHIFIIIPIFIPYFLFAVAFCFWSIYLIDAIRRKRACYNALKYLGDANMETYKARTELVQYVIIFCINLIEWMGCTFTLMTYTVNTVSYFHQLNGSISDSRSYHEIMINKNVNIPTLDNICMVMCLVLIGSLCMYLAARQARLRWIKSNTIPYWICFFLLCSIVTQILITVCYTSIIGEWIEILLIGIALTFVWKQYRKLDMVIQWSIVDLGVRRSTKSLEKRIIMKRSFNRIFKILCIGALLMFSAEIIRPILGTMELILRPNSGTVLIFSICEFDTSNYSNPDSTVIRILFLLEGFLGVTGCLFFFAPYAGYGLKSMLITLWRLFRGKSGFKTRFSNPLYATLIPTTRRNVCNI